MSFSKENNHLSQENINNDTFDSAFADVELLDHPIFANPSVQQSNEMLTSTNYFQIEMEPNAGGQEFIMEEENNMCMQLPQMLPDNPMHLPRSQNVDNFESSYRQISQTPGYYAMTLQQAANMTHSSQQQPYEHHQMHQQYDQITADQFVLNQHNMYSASRLAFNPDPAIPFSVGPNLPPQGINVNSNRISHSLVEFPATNNSRAHHMRGRMPRLSSGSSSRPRRDVERKHGQTSKRQSSTSRNNHQSRDVPDTRLIPNKLYDPSYADEDKPVDPFLRMLKENPNFCNPKGSK